MSNKFFTNAFQQMLDNVDGGFTDMFEKVEEEPVFEESDEILDEEEELISEEVDEELEVEEEVEEEYPLQYVWTMWYHDIKSNDWSKSSYIRMGDISTIKEFWMYYNNIPDMTFSCFFLMKKGIFPEWTEESNIDGGRWSFVIQNDIVMDSWLELSMGVIGNYLFSREDIERINGIELQRYPKSGTIKIWNNDGNPELKFQTNISNLEIEEAKYVTNKTSCAKDKQKRDNYKSKRYGKKKYVRNV
jgi:hypothetical protein